MGGVREGGREVRKGVEAGREWKVGLGVVLSGVVGAHAFALYSQREE